MSDTHSVAYLMSFSFGNVHVRPPIPSPAIQPLTLNFEKCRGDLDNSTLITKKREGVVRRL